MTWTTADLCDAFDAELQVAPAVFQAFGGVTAFCGQIATVKVFEDNVLVRAALSEPGAGKVLVVDGGGSLNRALIGDQIAALAVQNGWAGVILWGCIRDSAAVAPLPLGVRALGTNPRKPLKQGSGYRDIALQFADVRWVPGAWVYADADGVVVAGRSLVATQNRQSDSGRDTDSGCSPRS
jgi:regulator of ribonuclease activity A